MPGLIQKWLGTQLGVVLDMTPEVFNRNVKSGKLLAQVLHSYGIVDTAFLQNLNDSPDVDVNYKTLCQLKPLLLEINVDIDDITLKNMADGTGTAALKVFYSVYLSLEKKDNLYYISRKEKVKSDSEHTPHFSCRWTPLALSQCPPQQYDCNLATTLLKNQNMISWERENCASTVQNILKIKHRFSAHHTATKTVNSHSKFTVDTDLDQLEKGETWPMKQDIIHFNRKHPYHMSPSTYQQLLEERKTFHCMPPLKVPNFAEADNFVRSLHMRTKKDIMLKSYQQKMQNLLLSDLMKRMLMKHDREFSEKVVANILKQSQFEKQICTKLSGIKYEKNVLVKNRRMAENLLLKAREVEFQDALNNKLERADSEIAAEKAESEKLNNLHFLLYRDKVKKKSLQNYDEGKLIVNYVIDITLKVVEFRLYNDCEIPLTMMRELKELFIHNVPIMESSENYPSCFSIGIGEGQEVIQEEFIPEEIMLHKMERQLVLNDLNFDDYIHLLGPWMVELLFPEEFSSEVEPVILGYMVHKLLSLKYPPLPPIKPAEINPMHPTSIILGLRDKEALIMLKDLLDTRKILIVQIPDVINYILNKYKDEIAAVKDIDLVFKEETKKSLQKKNPKHIKKSLSKKRNISKKEKKEEPTKDVETQTPRVIPEDDPLLSPSAQLGKIAYESLGLGEKVPDMILSPAIVQFVQEYQKYYSGWIILNYPQHYNQVRYLECLLTGFDLLPYTDKKDNYETAAEFECRGYCLGPVHDPEKNLRLSKLVPNMLLEESKQDPASYFDSLINITKKKSLEKSSKRKHDQGDSVDNTEVDERLTNFYQRQNLLIEFEYSGLDFTTIKELAKVILGDVAFNEDDEMIPNTSVDIFGDGYREILAKWMEKRKHPKHDPKSKPTKVKKVKPNLRGSKDVSDSILPPPPPPPSENFITGNEHEMTVWYPGDEGYVWASGTQPENILLALATIWETMEAVYIENMKEIFLSLRLHYADIIPYITLLKNNFTTFLNQPDEKQKLLSELQQYFNNLDDNLRPDVSVKCELHALVTEFEYSIWHMIDSRKQHSEDFRCSLIKEHWITDGLANAVNNFNSLFQLETDRCIDTCRVIHDYYATMAGLPLTLGTPNKISLPKLNTSDRKYSVISNFSSKGITSSGGTEQSFRFPSNARMDSIATHRRTTTETMIVQASEQIEDSLISLIIKDTEYTYYHQFCSESIDAASNYVIQIVKGYLNAANTYSVGDSPKKKTKKKASQLGSYKHERKSPKTDNNSTKRDSTATSKTQDSVKIGTEWTSALQCELQRFCFRTRLIKERALLDLSELYFTFFQVFRSLHDNIEHMYDAEIRSLSNCCHVFRHSIEEETPVQYELMLLLDEFIVRQDTLLFPDASEKSLPVLEPESPYRFQIQELAKMFRKLQMVSPDGEIPARSLMYIIEDWRAMICEDNEAVLFPRAWKLLEPEDLVSLFQMLYQKLEVVNWKDFIIYALNIPFPSEEEILEARCVFMKFDPQRTELIARDDFNYCSLWFNIMTDDLADNFRMELIKSLLFDMYSVDKDVLNYTALLLSFCKDVDPAVGFKKALALCCGKPVYLRDFTPEEEEDNEPLDAIHEIMSTLICDTLQETEGVILKDVPEESSVEENNMVIPSKSKPKIYPCSVKGVCDVGPTLLVYDDEGEENNNLIAESIPSCSISPEYISIIPKPVLKSLLLASYPSLSQLSMLMNCEKTVEQFVDAIYNSLENAGECVFSYRLIQHGFIYNLLTNTNKFKVISMESCILEIVHSKSDSSKLLLQDF